MIAGITMELTSPSVASANSTTSGVAPFFRKLFALSIRLATAGFFLSSKLALSCFGFCKSKADTANSIALNRKEDGMMCTV